jgi:transcriptional regulator with XRE-family HTH domain
MTEDNTTKLGTLLRQKREEIGLSIRALGRETDIPDTTIMRIEQGSIASPSPALLAKLSERLEVPLSELYELAGYAIPNDLPSMPAYLRTKYRDLPAPARKELNNYLERLRQQYGLDEHGPKDGEDET